MSAKKRKKGTHSGSLFTSKRFTNAHRHKALWAGALIFLAGCLCVCYYFLISPYTSIWRALYHGPEYSDEYHIRGIDVSHHQGRIDWDRVHDAQIGGEPVRFVFIKATDGLHFLDSDFQRNLKQAREVGILCGAYHFFRPAVSAREQARHFIRHAHLRAGDLPPVLDIEQTGGLSTSALQDSALVWLRLVEQHYGVKPILYTYYNFKIRQLSAPTFADYPHWIAHYYVSQTKPDVAWKFWQHSDREQVDGIRGKVDVNYYNGSMYELNKLTLPE
jgi:lysozyme